VEKKLDFQLGRLDVAVSSEFENVKKKNHRHK
jgi:hypothetical protein